MRKRALLVRLPWGFRSEVIGFCWSVQFFWIGRHWMIRPPLFTKATTHRNIWGDPWIWPLESHSNLFLPDVLHWKMIWSFSDTLEYLLDCWREKYWSAPRVAWSKFCGDQVFVYWLTWDVPHTSRILGGSTIPTLMEAVTKARFQGCSIVHKELLNYIDSLSEKQVGTGWLFGGDATPASGKWSKNKRTA